MKAIVQDRYGAPGSLRIVEVDRPTPKNNELLVRVHAAALNARDWHILRGDPRVMRLMAPAVFGLRGPRRPIRGSDVSGTVVEVGRDVTRWRAGDEVYGDLGDSDGAFAEYACLPGTAAERKPTGLTFEQAAAIPLAGRTALAGLRHAGRVAPGQRVLVNGASGGVGTFAVQIARALGAEVTGVCSPRNVELVRSIGADHVVDYTREDFTRAARPYDLVFDLVGNRSLGELRRALAPTGTLVLSGGGAPTGGRPTMFGPLGLMVRGQASSRLVGQRVVVLAVPPVADTLGALHELVESGQVVPVIDRTYPLAEVPEALRYLEIEHARAKVVITV